MMRLSITVYKASPSTLSDSISLYSYNLIVMLALRKVAQLGFDH